MSGIPKTYEKFKRDHPEVWEAVSHLGQTAGEVGPLNLKYRELIKLGMTAALGTRSAVKSHTHRALEAGASTSEIRHSLLCGVTTLGFPRMMTALAWANEAIQVHTPR